MQNWAFQGAVMDNYEEEGVDLRRIYGVFLSNWKGMMAWLVVFALLGFAVSYLVVKYSFESVYKYGNAVKVDNQLSMQSIVNVVSSSLEYEKIPCTVKSIRKTDNIKITCKSSNASSVRKLLKTVREKHLGAIEKKILEKRDENLKRLEASLREARNAPEKDGEFVKYIAGLQYQIALLKQFQPFELVYQDREPKLERRSLRFALPLLFGLMGFAAAGYYHYLRDKRIHGRHELDALLGTPVAFSLPDCKRKGEQACEEAVRSLRVLLENREDGLPTVILVASPQQGDGRSMLAVLLARILADAGRQTCLVDADMRLPGLHKEAGVGNGRGLAECLGVSGCDELDDCIRQGLQQTPWDGVRLLPAGNAARNPADLLASDGMEQVLSILKSECDVIVLDSPALASGADAAILARDADSILLMIREAHTTIPALEQAMMLLGKDARAKVLPVYNAERRA